jgi:hypothetical protein
MHLLDQGQCPSSTKLEIQLVNFVRSTISRQLSQSRRCSAKIRKSLEMKRNELKCSEAGSHQETRLYRTVLEGLRNNSRKLEL